MFYLFEKLYINIATSRISNNIIKNIYNENKIKKTDFSQMILNPNLEKVFVYLYITIDSLNIMKDEAYFEYIKYQLVYKTFNKYLKQNNCPPKNRTNIFDEMVKEYDNRLEIFKKCELFSIGNDDYYKGTIGYALSYIVNHLKIYNNNDYDHKAALGINDAPPFDMPGPFDRAVAGVEAYRLCEDIRNLNDKFKKKKPKRIDLKNNYPQMLLMLILFIAIKYDNPYGFYVLLRIVCFVTFLFISYIAYIKKLKVLMWVLLLLSIVYNPIIPITLEKGFWIIINIVTMVITALSIYLLADRE